MDDSLDGDGLDTQWAPVARERFILAGRSLLESIEKQLRLLETANEVTDDESVDASSRVVETAAVEYADAYFEFSGLLHPFGFLETFDADVDDEEGEDGHDEPLRGETVSVLVRADFRVVDEDVVVANGLRRYREHSGQDLSATNGTIGLGGAIYQLIHADGIESLSHMLGLDPLAAITQVILPEVPIEFDEDVPSFERPSKDFSVAGEVLFGAEDRW